MTKTREDTETFSKLSSFELFFGIFGVFLPHSVFFATFSYDFEFFWASGSVGALASHKGRGSEWTAASQPQSLVILTVPALQTTYTFVFFYELGLGDLALKSNTTLKSPKNTILKGISEPQNSCSLKHDY